MLSKIIDQTKIDQFAKWLNKAERIVIVAHVSPDGDAIGSSLGLWHFLSTMEKNARVIVPNAFPDFLKWMPGSKEILLYDRARTLSDKLLAEADLICCLDFNALHRIDYMQEAVAASGAHKILIDHHLHPEDFCQVVISHPNISSTSELVFRLICRMGHFDDISREGAECIYTGMMTRHGRLHLTTPTTGRFTSSSANCCRRALTRTLLYRRVYNTYSESRLRLMGHILTQMKVYPDCHTAVITLTTKEQKGFNYIRRRQRRFRQHSAKHQKRSVIVLLTRGHRTPDDKISLRSVGTFPCNQLAAEFFGGGGHLNASGGEFLWHY